ncbi:hypothetical protein E4U52_005616 [Claviceps spartinae]|nr:hypothetical protein E4U52_005616 [Claviceps spartinae]
MNQVPARIQHQNTPDSLRTGTWLAATGQAPQAIDHFRQYLDEDPIAAEEDFDFIDYWMKRRVTQPQLAQVTTRKPRGSAKFSPLIVAVDGVECVLGIDVLVTISLFAGTEAATKLCRNNIIYQSETFDAEPYNAASNRDNALGVTASEISQYIVKPLRDVEDSRPKNMTMTTTTVRHT